MASYKISPGQMRQLDNFAWTWDFDVSSVQQGHQCVDTQERAEASAVGAKLTFGEVIDAGVSRMLYNLEAHKKRVFHDLGMGPGKMLIQSFLIYSNLTRCVGVELARGRYALAEKNLLLLVKHGWRGRKFLEVEYKKGQFMKIVEITPNQTPEDGFRRGDNVIAYNRDWRTDAMDFPSYRAVVTKVHGDNSCTVEYPDGITKRIRSTYIFDPVSVRECEIWFGNLFDYPNGWDADMCILETDFPEMIREDLMKGMRSTPQGCTFLTYHDLKKWHGLYDHDEFRQLDVSIYDTDRYLTSWSQGWRFYLWEHIKSPHDRPSKLPRDLMQLRKEKRVAVLNRDDMWCWASVVDTVNRDTVEVEYHDSNKGDRIHRRDQRIRIHKPRFDVDDRVICYWPHFVENNMRSAYEMYFGTVTGHQPDGTYKIKYDDGDHHNSVKPHWVFTLPVLRYQVDDRVLSCWPQYAQNKNSADRYRKFPAVIARVNADGSYAVKYDHGDTADRVREMWITTTEEDKHMKKRHVYEMVCTPEVRLVSTWDSLTISLWLHELGLSSYSVRVLKSNIRGNELELMDRDDLKETFEMKRSHARVLYNHIQTIVERRRVICGKPWLRSNKIEQRRSRTRSPRRGSSVARSSRSRSQPRARSPISDAESTYQRKSYTERRSESRRAPMPEISSAPLHALPRDVRRRVESTIPRLPRPPRMRRNSASQIRDSSVERVERPGGGRNKEEDRVLERGSNESNGAQRQGWVGACFGRRLRRKSLSSPQNV